MNASNAALKTLAGRNRRPVVLCLDDDPAVLGSLRRLLGREPYEVVTTHNPNEALARMCRSTVDVIIADELMPRISGMAFLKIVEGRWPATARLIVSGHPDVPERVKGEARLVQHFIPKPWDVDELRTLLRGLIDRRRPGPAQAVRLPRRRPAWDFMVERPVLIEATGRTATELQSRLLRFLSRARLEGRDVVAVLEGLDQMKGDARTLLGHVAMAVDSSGVRLHLVDGSCTATEYFRSAEAFHPRIKVYDPSPAELASKDLLLVDPVAPRRVFLKVLLEGLGHPCRAVANPAEARVALDQHSFDVVLLELTHADDDGINLVRDLARTGRQISVVPMVSIPRAWAPSIARKWNLKTPLVRPHRFVELYDALR